MMRGAALFVAAAFLANACGSGAVAGNHGGVAPVDLLIIPADASYPPQVQHFTGSELESGNVDLILSPGSTVTAHVVSVSRVPINGADVRIRLRGTTLDTVVQTGPTGIFSLKLGAGVYDITVTPDRTIWPTLPPHVFEAVTVPSSGADVPLTLTMDPVVKIRGTVRNATGVLEGWRVSAREESGVQGSTYTTTTLAGFEIYVTGSGSWLVTATPPAASTDFPVGTKRIAVAGTSANFDFLYPSLTPHDVTGIVTGVGATTADFGGVVVRAKAQLSSSDPDVTLAFDRQTTTDATGAFALPVVPGTYTFYIEPGVDSAWSHAVIPTQEVTDVSTSPIPQALTTLKPKAAIAGTVLGAGGGAATSAKIRFSAADGTLYQFSKRTDGAGTFGLGVNVGKYAVEIVPEPESGLVRATSNTTVDHDATGVDFQLPEGARTAGRVLAEDGVTAVAGATVVAIDPDSEAAVGSAEALTDPNGHWVLSLPVLP